MAVIAGKLAVAAGGRALQDRRVRFVLAGLVVTPIAVVAGAVGTLLMFLLVLGAAVSGATGLNTTSCALQAVPSSSPTVASVARAVAGVAVEGYGTDQIAGAARIRDAAIDAGLGEQGAILGVMTAIGESTLRPLTYGDNAINPDGSVATSIGWFQQQDSWGSVAQRLDPYESAKLFYARLTAVPGWQLMQPTLAAHAVQINADAYFYAKFYDDAKAIVSALSGVPAGTLTCTSTTVSQQAGDDYPWPNELIDDQGGGLSPLRYYYRECVDFVAWRLSRDAGSTSAPFTYNWSTLTPLGGNAIDWPDSWKAKGWTISDQPVAGSVAWWGTSAGSYGHVAYVHTVNPDGTVTIEEYNWGRTHNYGTRTIPATNVDAFLYAPTSGT